MVAGDGDGVEFRHLIGRVFNDIRDDAHRRLWWIDVRVPHHELFEDVILDRPAEERTIHALFLARHDEGGENRNNCAVHRHGNTDFFERNTIKERLHVLDAIDGHASLTHVANHARVVTVIAPVGRQIERHRDTLLTCSQRLAIKGVRFLSRGKSRVLTDRPGPACIHRGLHTTREGRVAWRATINPRHVFRPIDRLHTNAFQRLPSQIIKWAPAKFLLGQFFPPIIHGVISLSARQRRDCECCDASSPSPRRMVHLCLGKKEKHL